jgi:cytosine/adenosine deaminase-related metal-dependent hydrolase
MIAAAGAVISVNTSSNLGLRSGIAPVAEMLRRGCRVAMGLDGLALDEDDDALRELRLLYHLHKGNGYDVAVTPAQAWQLAARHGRYAVSGIRCEGGVAAGEPADLLLLDGDTLAGDRLFGHVDSFDYVMARATASHIRALYVDGERIVADGRATGVDYAELMRQLMDELRARLKPDDAWPGVVRKLDAALKPFYLQGRHLGCG